jgi:hypothetical protein
MAYPLPVKDGEIGFVSLHGTQSCLSNGKNAQDIGPDCNAVFAEAFTLTSHRADVNDIVLREVQKSAGWPRLPGLSTGCPILRFFPAKGWEARFSTAPFKVTETFRELVSPPVRRVPESL